jgi:hypothetical protein
MWGFLPAMASGLRVFMDRNQRKETTIHTHTSHMTIAVVLPFLEMTNHHITTICSLLFHRELAAGKGGLQQRTMDLL